MKQVDIFIKWVIGYTWKYFYRYNHKNIPYFGVSSASFLLYLLCVSILMFKNKKAFYAVLDCLICILPQYNQKKKMAVI